MKTLLALLLLLAAVLPGRGQSIDFTQRSQDLTEDGVFMRRMYFSDNGQPIYYRPHASWIRFSDARWAKFQPKDMPDGLIKIENSASGNARIPFDEAGLKTLRSLAASLVPPDASAVTQTWEVVNPTVLQGWTSFEVGLDYVQGGKHFCRSILFINLDAERQIRFVVTAFPVDFQPLYVATYKSLATWYQPSLAAAH